MQQEQPQFYSSLAQHMTAEDQAVIQTVLVKAEEQHQQAMAQAQQVSIGEPAGMINGGAGSAT
jgi:importin-7